jgi:hypothetical protein
LGGEGWEAQERVETEGSDESEACGCTWG